jgi:hypothetical protein
LTRKWVNAFATQGFAPPDSKGRGFGLTGPAPRPRTTEGIVINQKSAPTRSHEPLRPREQTFAAAAWIKARDWQSGPGGTVIGVTG